MPRKAPELCKRKDGRYYVTDPANHRPVYFGRDLVEAEQLYGRWVMEFFARAGGVPASVPYGSYTVAFLLDRYLAHAETYYRKHGKPTSEVNTVEQISRVVRELYGPTRANDFRPGSFKAVRQALVVRGHARKHINRQMDRVRRIWRWGVEAEIVRADVLAALEAVARLHKGRSAARESPKIRPVAWEVVEATLPAMRFAYMRAMVRLHYLGAMRSQDVVAMRPCDIERSGPVWIYRPATWKTEHHEDDDERLVYLGPECQRLLQPILHLTSPKGWLFPSRGRGRHSGRGPGHITVNGYRQAVETAVNKVNRERAKCKEKPLPHWYPLQLRHAALTAIRKRFGLEGAQVMGGHAHAAVTEIYAERDQELAERIAAAIG